MRARWPSQQILMTVLLLAAAVGLRVWDPDPVARLRLSVFDSYLRASPRVADPAMPVKIVDIDAESLQRIGQWPWPRSRLADLVVALRGAGAQSIAFDIILAEPDRVSPGELARLVAGRPELQALADAASQLPSNDQRLAEAIAGGKVAMGFVAHGGAPAPLPNAKASFAFAGDDPKDFVPGFPAGTASLAPLSKAADGFGSVNWLPSQDLVVRRVPLLVTVGTALYPSLALEALRIGSGQTTVQIKASGGSGMASFGQHTGIELIKLGATVLPAGHDGELWLNFAEHDDRRYVPASSILDGSFRPEDIAGRHIFIGTSAPGLLDLRATPLQASVPGVEIHAQALEQIISGQHIVRPAYATGAELIYLVLAGAALAFLLRRVGPVWAAFAGTAALAVVVLASWLLFANAGLLFDPVYPSLALVAIYLATSLSTYVKAEMDRAFVRQAFGHYVAPKLVEQLAQNAESLKLGGESREITLLFSDVRGFSRISEGMDAESLVRFINELFTPIAEVILDEHGTIDKFMGDAVMAFWNAPVHDPDHARRAARAALRMLDAVDVLNETRATAAVLTGDSTQAIRIGIGLNTGACVVGNVGSPQRFDYSILGDVVNIASRLEGETKTFGASIIAGEATVAQVQDFAFLEIGRVALRGKDRSERVYALAGDESFAASPAFAALKSAHTRLMRARDAGDASEATKALAEARRLSPRALGQLFDVYAERVALAAPAAH